MLITITQVQKFLHSITACYTFECTVTSNSYFKLNGKRFNLPVNKEDLVKELKKDERNANCTFN